jgi:hypothetical protein
MEHTLFPASWEALLAQYEKRGASKEVLKTARTILAELYAAGIGHGKSSSRNALCLTLHEGGYIPIQFVETNPSSGFAIVFDCKSNGELRYSQVIPDEYAIMEKERCIDNRLL